MGYIGVITHPLILTFDPNFQRDIQVDSQFHSPEIGEIKRFQCKSSKSSFVG